MPELYDRLQAALRGTYTLERELAAGGMARVFVAEERALGRRVVIKVLSTDVAERVSLERFRREVQLAATLQHPHIVPVLAAGEADGIPFYVMPYVTGESLRVPLAEHRRVPVARVIRILRDVASALAFAHRHGVVHRDIKPENILLSSDDALVTDFGIAKAIASATGAEGAHEDARTLTAVGAVIGTPSYMSPEQVTAGLVDGRSDIYALGCVAFELLAGHPPFASGSAQQILVAHVSRAAPSVEKERADIPRPLATLVARCLQKSPDDRPRFATDVVAALDAMAGTTAKRPSGRTMLLAAAAALALGAVAVTSWRISNGRSLTTGHEMAPSTGIAVLPLRSVGADTANRWFADGTTEELATELQKLAGVRVMSPASAAAAVSRVGRDPQAIGKLLGIGWLLDGSVRRAGSELRLTLRLVSVSDGAMTWSEEYQRTISNTDDIFRIQSEIARAVAGTLRVTLLERTQAAGEPVSLAAHDLYLQGRSAAARFTEPELRRAIQLYDSALAREPRYALAWAAKSEAWSYLADAWLAPRDAYPRSKDAAQRALAIDSTLAEAHAMLADVTAIYDWNPRAAEVEATRALALNPRSVPVLTTVIFQLMSSGQLDSTVVLLDRAQQLDPFNTVIRFWKASTLFAAHRVKEGCDEAARAIAIAPDGMAESWGMGECLLLTGRARDALPHLERAAPYSTQMQALYARGLAMAGRGAEARALVDSLERESRDRYVSGTALASAYAALGDHDSAFRSLERALRDRSAELAIIPLRTIVAALQPDPRFDDILRRMRPM